MGCTVDTLTLSIQQKILAEERIAEEGLQDKIRVHLLDYRNLPEDFEHQFDAFICVEMVEVPKWLPSSYGVRANMTYQGCRSEVSSAIFQDP